MKLLKKILIRINVRLINFYFKLIFKSHNFSKYLLYNLQILIQNIDSDNSQNNVKYISNFILSIYISFILKCVYV